MNSDELAKLLRQKAYEAVGAYVFKETGPNADGKIDIVGEEKSAPASVMARTDAGLVLVLDPAILLNRSAADLRSVGMVVPNDIPDIAVVVRESSGQLVYKWCESA